MIPQPPEDKSSPETGRECFTVNYNEIQAAIEAKQAWVRPQLQRMEAGSAESQRGENPDGGGGVQGS